MSVLYCISVDDVLDGEIQTEIVNAVLGVVSCHLNAIGDENRHLNAISGGIRFIGPVISSEEHKDTYCVEIMSTPLYESTSREETIEMWRSHQKICPVCARQEVPLIKETGARIRFVEKILEAETW